MEAGYRATRHKRAVPVTPLDVVAVGLVRADRDAAVALVRDVIVSSASAASLFLAADPVRDLPRDLRRDRRAHREERRGGRQ